MHAADSVWDPPTDLIDVDRFDGVPRQGIGRSLKVGKEELAGLITALDLFVEEDHATLGEEWLDRASLVAERLVPESALSTRVTEADKVSIAPEVVVTLDEEAADLTTTDLVLSLRREDPRIFVGADSLADDAFTINPMCLTDDQVSYVVDRIRSYL